MTYKMLCYNSLSHLDKLVMVTDFIVYFTQIDYFHQLYMIYSGFSHIIHQKQKFKVHISSFWFLMFS